MRLRLYTDVYASAFFRLLPPEPLTLDFSATAYSRSAYPRTVLEKWTVPFFLADSEKLGQSPTVLYSPTHPRSALSVPQTYAGFAPLGISRSRTTSQARPTFSISQIR
jgi:hypothetical protein